MKTIILLVAYSFISLTTLGQVGTSMEDYVKNESKGGKFDFEKTLADKEGALLLFDGVAYSKKDFAIFLWGQAMKRLDKFSLGKSIKLWQEINGRKLTAPEKRALKRGYKAKLQ